MQLTAHGIISINEAGREKYYSLNEDLMVNGHSYATAQKLYHHKYSYNQLLNKKYKGRAQCWYRYYYQGGIDSLLLTRVSNVM